MNKLKEEQYQQIIDEVYRKYGDSHTYFVDGWEHVTPIQHSKKSFIEEIKINPEFSEKWGLKIEERELRLGERYEIQCKKENVRNDWEQFYSTFGGYKDEIDSLKKSLNNANIPTKLITITYNNETIESYE